MTENMQKNKQPNTEKLVKYGFLPTESGFILKKELADIQMTMMVSVSDIGEISAKTVDDNTGEEYVLHLDESACGAFVGKVRAEYEAIISDITEKCFDSNVFRNNITKEVIRYVRRTYGDELEFLWERYPENAVWRRADNRKWYGALLKISRQKLGQASDEKTDILDLRIRPEEIDTLVDKIRYFPGYHMNKKHWITVCLDGTVELPEICRRIDESYMLALKK